MVFTGTLKELALNVCLASVAKYWRPQGKLIPNGNMRLKYHVLHNSNRPLNKDNHLEMLRCNGGLAGLTD